MTQTLQEKPIGLFAQAGNATDDQGGKDARPADRWEPRKHARSTDSASSHRAAERLALKADTQCGKVLAILRRGPIANAELYAECGAAGVLNPRARVSDLRKWGYTIDVDDDGVYRLIHQQQKGAA
jgi:hypothetical protein